MMINYSTLLLHDIPCILRTYSESSDDDAEWYREEVGEEPEPGRSCDCHVT